MRYREAKQLHKVEKEENETCVGGLVDEVADLWTGYEDVQESKRGSE